MTTKPVKLEDFFDTCPVCEYRLGDDDDVCPACGESLIDPEDFLKDIIELDDFDGDLGYWLDDEEWQGFSPTISVY